MRTQALALCALLAAFTASAQTAPSPAEPDKPANEQVIVPEVARRNVKLPRYPSNDFEVGVFAGTYATENFGTTEVDGLRLGYHVTEDVFFEGVFGRTKVNDSAFRQVLPGGIFPTGVEKLYYTNVSVGLNLLPGEVFIGRNFALASSAYVIAGLGTTRFNQQRLQTFNLGGGFRVFLGEGVAVQADARDHIYSVDLLGKRRVTQNLELTAGLTFFF